MRPLDVEEGLDFVEAEIKRFHARYDTGDFHLLSCGPEPGLIGDAGGPVGAVIWGCQESKFPECQKMIRSLLRAVEQIDLVVDVEVEPAWDNDGEVWTIEFAKECDLPGPPPQKKHPWEH